ncbi:XPA-BINDING PROTEIN 1-RELATED [Salix koriyanagi]|uniref:GPN-loop GTPase n=1 Tax=Salix koriyanagi TaxID=2511006 RepID=A0A9Q1AI24_9ROSI|nr:XPA-BINDING PROTEIN 1-RELATED [Salix koriyanagi]
MDIDSKLDNADVKSGDEGSSSMQVDSKGTVEEKDELTDSMNKLNVEASSSGHMGQSFRRKPVIIIVVGMAGSGKTTFLHRDTIKYKEVMKQFNLGPNGGILTSLNLFATKFDEVIQVIENRADQLDYVLVDTPGQIEIFTWSASGAIITEAFASTFPTVVAYVVDTPRSSSPVTFMSNMLYACSILYKTRLPLVLAFNKTDVAQHQFALEWMEDFEAFQAAMRSDESYMSTFSQSLSLVLDEFYKNLRSVGVSAVSGAGMDAFFEAIEASAEEYLETYKSDLDKRRAEKQQMEEEQRKHNMEKAEEGHGTIRGTVCCSEHWFEGQSSES